MDALLSNSALSVWALFADWVPYVLTSRKETVVAFDWTEFDAGGHSAIALYLATSHGRATPWEWMTVKKARLEGRRNKFEDAVILRLHDVLPPGVKVTLLADRGIGDQKLYEFLTEPGFGEFGLREPMYLHAFGLKSRDGSVTHQKIPGLGAPKTQF